MIPGTTTVIVELTPEQRFMIEHQITAALHFIAHENALSDLQVYLVAMYVMGGYAASARVTPEDKTTFTLFRKGYDDYLDWRRENEPRGATQ